MPPPLSIKSEKKMKLFKATESVWDQMVQMQIVDDDSKTTDVHFICLDGFIAAHAFVLQSVSPFFDRIFMSQGENYPVVRYILVPDYKIIHVRAIIQLLYSGSVTIENEKEAEAVKAILKEWEIENKGGVEFQKISRKGSKKPKQVLYYLYSPDEAKKQAEVNVKIEPPSDELEMEKCDNSVASPSSSSSISQPQRDRSVSPETVTPKAEAGAGRRSLRPRTNLRKRVNLSNDDSEEEETESVDSDSCGSESESDGGRKRRTPRKLLTSVKRSTGRPTRSTAKGSNVNKKPEIITSDNEDGSPHMSSTDSSSGSESDLEGENSTMKGKKKVVKGKPSADSKNTPTPGPSSKAKSNNFGSDGAGAAGGPTLQRSSNKSSSDSDSDGSHDDVKSIYKNPNLFAEAAKVCGKCKKKYSNPKEASDCITERHKLVRCYFCFDVCDNTEKLFQHYGEKHKKAGRENTLLCPFCQQAVPYKSVSTHVISNHLFATAKNKNEQGRVGQVGRPSTLSVQSASQPGPKRLKTGSTDEPVKKPDDVPKKEKESDSSDDDSMLSTSNMVIKKRDVSGKMKVILLEKDKK